MIKELKFLLGVAAIAVVTLIIWAISQIGAFFAEAQRIREKRDLAGSDEFDWQFWDRMLKCHYLTMIPFVNRKNSVTLYMRMESRSERKRFEKEHLKQTKEKQRLEKQEKAEQLRIAREQLEAARKERAERLKAAKEQQKAEEREKAEQLRLEKERQKAEEKARIERQKAEEREKAEQLRLEKEREKAEEKARIEQQKAEEREKAEQLRLEKERQKAEEQARIEQQKAEEREKAEQLRLEKERQKAEERARIEQQKAEEREKAEQLRLEKEREKAEEKARIEQQKAEEREKAEQLRLEKERQKAEEQARIEQLGAAEKEKEKQLKLKKAQLRAAEKEQAKQLRAEQKKLREQERADAGKRRELEREKAEKLREQQRKYKEAEREKALAVKAAEHVKTEKLKAEKKRHDEKLRSKKKAENKQRRAERRERVGRSLAPVIVPYAVGIAICLAGIVCAWLVRYDVSYDRFVAVPADISYRQTENYVEYAAENLSSVWYFDAADGTAPAEFGSGESVKLGQGRYVFGVADSDRAELNFRISADTPITYTSGGEQKSAETVYIKHGGDFTVTVYEDCEITVFCTEGSPRKAEFAEGGISVGRPFETYTFAAAAVDVAYDDAQSVRNLYIGRLADHPAIADESPVWSDGSGKVYAYLTDGENGAKSLYILSENNVKLQISEWQLRYYIPLWFPNIANLTVSWAKFTGTSLAGYDERSFFESWNNGESMNYIDLSGLKTAAPFKGADGTVTKLGVDNLYCMFSNQSGLKYVSLGGDFDTSLVRSFQLMFESTGLVTLDLSGFSLESATYIAEMFTGSRQLKTIYVRDGDDTWIAFANASEGMFAGCASIKGGHGTLPEKIKKADPEGYRTSLYARIDTKDTPGYFTAVSQKDESEEEKLLEAALSEPLPEPVPVID